LRNEIRDSLTSANATPSSYRTPDQRKLDADKVASNSGQSIAEEAKAREDAAASNALAEASTTEKPQVVAEVAVVEESKASDADIASLV
jgi:hypothetical protein